MTWHDYGTWTPGANAFIGFDESADKFVLGTTTNTAADTGNLNSDTSGSYASTLLIHTLEATTVNGTLATAAQPKRNKCWHTYKSTSSGTIDADTFTTDSN